MATERRAAPEKVHDYWVRQWEHREQRYYKRENDLYGRLIAFSLDMEHYKRNINDLSADARRIQPKGQQLYNLIRHKAALLSTPPIMIEARPVQPTQDADAAIIARRVIETRLEDPKTRYKLIRHRMVLSALAGGRGVVAIEYDRAAGGTVLRNCDPRRVMHTPGFLDMHDPRTPDVIEEVPMRLSAVRAKRSSGWKVPSDLVADNRNPNYPGGTAQESHQVDLGIDAIDNGASVGDGTDDDGIVTILKCYSRRDPFKQTRIASVPKDLPQEQWYWTDDAQMRVPFMESPQEPFPGARLVTQDEDQRELELYSDGCLCIIAPYYQGKKPLWQGSWLPDAVNTDVRLRSFPFMDMPGYLHPLRRAGKCDTELNASLQQIDNMSLRAAWNQMRSAGLVGVVPWGGLFKSDGQTAFELTDEPIQLAYAKDRMAMEGISWMQAPGMNTALPQFRTMLNQEWSYIGTGDISMPADRSRDIAVGTIEALQKTGDLPVQMHRDIMQAEEAIAFGVILDYERAYRSDAELVQWVTDEGELASAQVSGADLVDVNVIITASPDMHALDADRIQAISQFVGQMQTMPQLMSAMAPMAGIPPEGVRNIQRAVAQMMQQQQAMQQQAAMGQTAPPPVTQPA